MTSKVKISFLGAAGTVTGSRYLLESSGVRVLVDCGIFQGYKNLRERNWRPFPVEPAGIDAVFVTHAHLDHSGYLPKLVAEGFNGPIYCTEATRDLCAVLLPDSAHLQEEEAAFRNRHKYSKHEPALPLYTGEDVKRTLALFQPVPFATDDNKASINCSNGLKASFYPNGHILGSSFIDLEIAGKHLLFSGDVGRPNDPLMRAPQKPVYCDYLICESTYGNRDHDQRDMWQFVADTVSQTAARGGSILIPSFAVGRAQVLLHLLLELRQQKRIPYMPIYLDSPMAIRATEIMTRHQKLHRLSAKQCREIISDIHFTNTVEQSQAISMVNVPCVILSASGMATGGRVLHHLQRMLPDHRNTVLFGGYQAGGTRGARLVAGAESIKIFREQVPVRAEVQSMEFLSAHADRSEMIRWLRDMPVPPKQTFVTHGEADASDQFRFLLEDELQWAVTVPYMGETVEL
jgi:metallo-beta-lactamase family protein